MSKDPSVVVFMKQYAKNKKIKELLTQINPILAKREENVKIHLEALVNHLLSEDEFKVIETKMMLGRLCLDLEESLDDAFVTMLFYSKEENKIYHGAAPNIPVEFFDFFNDINNLNYFGESCGSCGKAVFHRQVVITDINTDPLWRPFREHFKQTGFQTGWSIPFFRGNEVIGTFAIYHKYKKEVTEEEVLLVKRKIKEYEYTIINISNQLLVKEG